MRSHVWVKRIIINGVATGARVFSMIQFDYKLFPRTKHKSALLPFKQPIMESDADALRYIDVWPPALVSHRIARSLTRAETPWQRSLKPRSSTIAVVSVTEQELHPAASARLSNTHFTPSGSLDPLASSSLHCITKCSHFGSRRAHDRALVASRPHSHHWACNETMDFPSVSWH